MRRHFAAFIVFAHLPSPAEGGVYIGIQNRFGITSPNRTSQDDSIDPKSYRLYSQGAQLGYVFPYLSFFLEGGETRYNNERTIVPLKYFKLKDFYYGGGLSIGPKDSIALHAYASKVQFKNLTANNIADSGIKAASKNNGMRFGAMLTGNRVFLGKSREKTDLQFLMGFGAEQTLFPATSTVDKSKRNFLSYYFTMDFNYMFKEGGLGPIGRMFQ